MDVAVRSTQSVVQSGPYRFVRHPSYTAILVMLLGESMMLANWASLVVILTGGLIGLLYRVRVEERALGSPTWTICARSSASSHSFSERAQRNNLLRGCYLLKKLGNISHIFRKRKFQWEEEIAQCEDVKELTATTPVSKQGGV